MKRRLPNIAVTRGLLLALLALACGREPAREPPPPAAAPQSPLPEHEKKVEGAPAEESAAQPTPAEPAAAPAAAPPPPASIRPAAKPTLPRSKIDRRARSEDRSESTGDDARADTALLRQRLQDALRQATPDCPAARSRKQAICELAHQICQMVDRDPEIASVEAYCADARQRCSEAEQRTAERCK